VWGISQFSGSGDSTSSYQRGFDYYQDVLQNFDHFGLPHAKLLRASSTDPEALQLIASRKWDMIYIDGNHDYEVVLKDWEACAKSIKPGGIIVLDDSGLTTAYRAPVFATAGIEGPSRVAQEIDRREFREVLQVGHNRAFEKVA
jgi:predicted O-methyltransferase YrrM